MASKPLLKNSVARLFGLGKTVRQVWSSIKNNPTYKFYTNKIIQEHIDAYKAFKSAGQALMNALPTKKIGNLIKAAYRSISGISRISYKFNFNFPARSASGKQGYQEMHDIIDVPSDTTKEKLMELIKQRVQQWIEDNYGSDRAKKARPRITITSLEGI